MNGRQALVEKAERFIRSATMLINDQDWDSAASRLYYAMFYAAEALLDARGLAYSSHQGVVSGFGQAFAKTGELDPRFHRVLITAYEKRQVGDYAAISGLTKGEVEQLRSEAIAFLEAAKAWLARNAPQT